MVPPTFFLCLTFAWSLTSVPAYADTRKQRKCEDWVVSLSETAERQQGLIYLQPGQQRFVIGSLIRAKNGKPLLGITGYGGNHEAIEAAFQIAQEDGEFGEYTYEWMGEMRWMNPREVPAQAAMVEANETAGGFIRFVEPNGLGKNQVGRLVTRLKKHDRVLRSRGTKRLRALSPTRLKVNFERSKITQSFHLMPGLDEYIGILESFKNVEFLDKNENYRHFLPDKVQGTFGAVHSILGNYSGEFERDQEKLDALHHKFNYALGRESIQLILKWLKNDGISGSTIARLDEMMQTLMIRPLTLGEWFSFKQVIEEFESTLLSYFDRDQQVARVELYLLEN